MANKKSRPSPEISSGSMADIAFMLLFFFLVTSQIQEDAGVLVKLPPWSEEPPETEKLKTRNVFSVLVNSSNELLVRLEPVKITDLRERCKEFIMNPQKREDLAEDPTRAIVSLKNDRGTKYKTYLEVYNELMGAYNELREESAQKKYKKPYDKLTVEQKKAINNSIPLVISEAEPTSFGEESK